jgi:hypothetical protein
MYMAELPWEPAFDIPDYKEVGRMLMNFSRMPRDEVGIAPNFENDAEYEKAVLDGCVPPESLCPAKSQLMRFWD